LEFIRFYIRPGESLISSLLSGADPDVPELLIRPSLKSFPFSFPPEFALSPLAASIIC